MEHEEIYVMMMDALDGELAEEQSHMLYVHLDNCPHCLHEWRALLAIDHLFRHTPALSPAAGFTQRTLARLPNRSYRVWLISGIYILLLFSGALPLLVGIWAVSRYGAVITEPGMVHSLLQAVAQMAQVVGAVMGALFNGVGKFVIQQPAVLGWLLVMIGIVSVWTGIFTQLLGTPQWRFSQSSVNS